MFHQVWLAPDDYHTLEFPWWPNNHLSKGPVDYLILLHLSWVRSYPEVGCRRRVEMPLYPILWQLVSDFCFIQLLKSLLNFSLSTDKFCSISRPNMRMLCDHIPPEAWKEGGLVSSKVLHSPSIRSGMRRSSLRIESWVSWLNFSRREICPYATTGKALCSTLLQAKLFVRSSERMKDFLVDRLWDEQAGFCKERPCCDQIATLRIIVEQTLEWNTGLYSTAQK